MEGSPRLPMPRSWFFFTCASLLGATALLVISMLDLGYLSLWVNPCVSIYTYIFHGCVIVVSFRKRHLTTPSYFSTVIICGYFLTFVWLGAVIVTVAGVVAKDNTQGIVALREHGLPVNIYTQWAQVFLTVYEMGMIGGMAAKGHAIVATHGPDPPDWRRMAEEEDDGGKGYWDEELSVV